MPVKPTLFSDQRDPTDEQFDPWSNEGAIDPGRIIGYDAIVKANDIDKADALTFREQNQGMTKEQAFKLVGSSPQLLPVEFGWLPISNAVGGVSQAAAQQLDHFTTREGFRVARMEDVTSWGYSLPPSTHVAADGSIRRGSDVALYVRSGEVARKWERYRAEKAAQAEGSSLPDDFDADGYSAPTFRSTERTHDLD